MDVRTYSVLAEALKYPAPGQVETLELGVDDLPSNDVRKSFSKYLVRVKTLTLAEWEELYTRTLDLNPAVAPYVGFQVWGDSYQRGAFMAKLNGAMHLAGVPTYGELPDHLIPILNYLGAGGKPLPELDEVLPPAIESMRKQLRKSEPENPYIWLFDAITRAVNSRSPEKRDVEGEALHGSN